MPSKRLTARIAGPLVLAVLAIGFPAPAPAGGPITDMMARHRARQQMRIPPMDKPFSGRPVKDISPSSLTDKFKKRFSLMRPMGSSTASGGLFSSMRDSGVTRTSR